jgi:hypothetical protein
MHNFGRKTEGKIPLRRSRDRREVNIKIGLEILGERIKGSINLKS